MGIVHKGIPKDFALSLKRTYDLDTLVETGTLVGNTADWAAENFHRVITIERDAGYYQKASERLSKHSNVSMLFGKSEDILFSVVSELQAPALFWLDAHWSRDLGYSKPDLVCPVLYEFSAIMQDGEPHIVLVDDARLFGVEAGWPGHSQMKSVLSANNRTVFILDDVFVSLP